MKKNQSGFTLIELMIVVAIIGILAAIALPAYQDYVTKTKVREGVSLSAPARTALGILCSEGEKVASLGESWHTSLGLEDPTSYSGKYTKSVTVGGSSSAPLINVEYLDFGAVTEGDEVIYTGDCEPGGLNWTVTVDGMDAKFTPKN